MNIPVHQLALPVRSTFKRLAIGAIFSPDTPGRKHDHSTALRYRKTHAKGATFIRPDGRGQTHARVPFSRSASVLTHESGVDSKEAAT